MAEIKTLPLQMLIRESFACLCDRWQSFAVLTATHIALLAAGFELIDGWHDLVFLPWLIVYYLYWCFFFRFYFGKKPYLEMNRLAGTLVPSVKILALSFFVLTALLVLPLLPILLGGDADWAVDYSGYLQKYMEDGRLVDGITLFVFLLVSPFIYFRPMMAWIGSLLGRSGAFKTAFARTKGNYWRMFFLLAVFELALAVFGAAGQVLGAGKWLFIIFGSPLMVFLNLILAKTYDYFFLEIDG